ncbi:hypothetical protein G7046_g8848 [Stylonectria norvegica]|nr:hypothetical protein G7046_g8848 [Stylonectria norvegica]
MFSSNSVVKPGNTAAQLEPSQKRPKLETPPADPGQVVPSVPHEALVEESHGYAWKLCNEKETAERLAVKEAAVKHAVHYGQELSDLLSNVIAASEAAENAGMESDAVLREELVVKTEPDQHDTAISLPKDTSTVRLPQTATTTPQAPKKAKPRKGYLQQWVESISDLVEKHRNFEILVGVAGSTGAGKSSLLSAVLGTHEIFPSGQQEAATAVSCKVSWNRDDRPGYENRADIHFQNPMEVLTGIITTFKAIKARHTISNTEYADETQRMNDLDDAVIAVQQGMANIRPVWPSDEEALEQEIILCSNDDAIVKKAKRLFYSNKAVFALLKAGVMTIYNEAAEELAKQVKPYLDTTIASHGGDKQFAAWPLIETVKIFLRNDLLKTGISVVDLPGIGDQVESRAQAAQAFYRKLDVHLVVAPVHRAADDKATWSLMTDYQEVRMKLDGKFNKQNFGVVLSKVDDLQVASYIKQHGGDVELVVENQEAIEEATKSLHHLEGKKFIKSQELKAIIPVVRDLEKDLAKFSSNKPGKKRLDYRKMRERTKTCLSVFEDQNTLRDSVAECLEIQRNAQATVESELRAIFQQIDNLNRTIDDCHENLTYWAIKSRSDFVCARMRQDFKRRQSTVVSSKASKGDKNKDELMVIPTSTTAYWKIKDGVRCRDGFPTEVYTGVPYVRQWLHAATATRREEHLDSMLSAYYTAFCSIEMWCTAQKSNTVFSFNPDSVQMALDVPRQKCHEKLREKFAAIYRDMEKLDPLKDYSIAKQRFKKGAAVVAHRWALREPGSTHLKELMPYGTYGACLRRNGGQYTTSSQPRRTYNWIENLAAKLNNELVSDWHLNVNIETPKLGESAVLPMKLIWFEYLAQMKQIARATDPALGTCFDAQQLHLMSVVNDLTTKVKTLLKTFPKKVSVIHDRVLTLMQESLEPTFQEAYAIKGTGSYIKRRELVEQRVREKTPALFLKSWDEMKNGLGKTKQETLQDLTKLASEAMELADMHVALLLDNAFGLGNTAQADRDIIAANMTVLLKDWRAAWQFPKIDNSHILLQDVSIPTELVRDNEDGDDESGSETASEGDSGDEDEAMGGLDDLSPLVGTDVGLGIAPVTDSTAVMESTPSIGTTLVVNPIPVLNSTPVVDPTPASTSTPAVDSAPLAVLDNQGAKSS